MFNLLHTINIFGIQLDLGEYEDVFLLLLALVAVVAIVAVVVALIAWYAGANKRSKEPTTATPTAAEQSPAQEIEPVAKQSPAVFVQTDEVVEDDVVDEDEDEPDVAVNSAEIIANLETANVDESEMGAKVIGADGTAVYYSYNKSFAAKLSQATDEVRHYYNVLENFVLGYKKVKTNVSWKQESVHHGKDKVCWFVLRGKSLYLYLPLNPDDYADSKYKVERVEHKRYSELPCLYKINNNRRLNYATELIATVMYNLGAERTQKPFENLLADFPYESTLSLIKRGRIKVTKSKRIFANIALSELDLADKK